MARIRTLKPEFWDSPSTAQADLAVRLTFMAMWNWADDSGHGTANLKELEAFCWPNDDVRDLPRGGSGDRRGKSAHGWRNFAEICGEVAEVYGVTFYRVSGRPYYEITNFKKHQSKDYRKESRYPLPDEGEIFDVTSGNAISGASASDASDGPSGGSRGKSAAVAGESGIGTGEQGNRGTEEKGSREVAVRDPARKRATRIPDNFTPSPEVIEAMRAECPRVDLEAENRKFVVYWSAKAGKDATKLDWDATWRNWIRRAKDSNVSQFPARQTASEKSQGWLNTVDEAVRLMGGNQ